MTGDSTFMLLRARVGESDRERFAAWFRSVHLRDVEKIPGIVGVRGGRTPGGVNLGFYNFASNEMVQAALQSPQAAYARGSWEQWAPNLEELSIEIWAPLGPLPLYHGVS